MPGPWEQYQTKPEAAPKAPGPWDQYKPTKPAPSATAAPRQDMEGPGSDYPQVPDIFPKKPGVEYGSILPLSFDPKTGKHEFAAPDIVRDPANAIHRAWETAKRGRTDPEAAAEGVGAFLGARAVGALRLPKRLPGPNDLVQQWATDLSRRGFAGSKELTAATARGAQAEAELGNLKQQLEASIAGLRSGAETAAQARIDALNQQANRALLAVRESAEAAANELRKAGGENAETAYNQIMSAAEKQIQDGKNFLERYNALVQRTLSGAEQIRGGIGKGDLTAKQTFGPVREQAEKALAAEKQALGTSDTELRTQLGEVVAKAEAEGRGIDATNAYKELTGEIDTLKRTDESKLSPFARMEPTTKKLYEKVEEYLRPQPVKLTKSEYDKLVAKGDKSVREVKGRNELGEETTTYMRDLRPSMNDIDGLRRWLGKVFAGKIEGFEAIAGTEKEKLYGILDRMENEYAATDDLFRRMQANYRSYMDRLAKFEGKTGSKLVEKEERTGVYKTDVESLGGLFKTSSQIDNLIEVSGAPDVVRAAGRNMIARDITSADASGVRRIIEANRGMFEHPMFKDLRADLERLEGRLKRAEAATSVREKAGRGSVRMGEKIVPETEARSKAMQEAEKAKAEIIAKAEKEAGGVMTEAEKTAEKSMSAVERRAMDIRKEEMEKARKAEQDIRAKSSSAEASFKSAMADAKVKEKMDELTRFANMVEREKGQRGVYEVDTLVAKMTGFLRDPDVVRLVPPEILSAESRKLGEIMKLQDHKDKMAALKRELAIMGSQAASGRLKSALGTALRLPGKF